MKKSKTYHDGANEERSAILAKVRRLKKYWAMGEDHRSALDRLIDFEKWLLRRNERYDARTGGLGKR